MIIMERYEAFYDFVYPHILKIPNKHKIWREEFLKLLLKQPDLLYAAVNSCMPGKINAADDGVDLLRWHLRCLSKTNPNTKEWMLSHGVNRESQQLLSEVGKIIGAWKQKLKK